MPLDLCYRLALRLLSGLLRLLTRPQVRGLHRLPDGPVIVVCNHISLADPPVLAAALSRSGRLPRPMATAGLFRAPVLGRLLRGCGFIPVHRGAAHAADALTPALEALAAGQLLVLYPEGGIPDNDGWPGPGKTGAARLALTANVPVVPVAQWGAHRLLPPHRAGAWWRLLAAFATRPHVHVSVGAPLQLTGSPEDPASVRAATDTVMAALTGQLEQLRGPRPAPDLAA